MRSRDHDVVVVKRIIDLGYWEFGMGRGWGGVEKGEVKFTSNLRPRWTGSYHTKEGFQVSKGKWKRSKGESGRGGKKQGDCAIIVLSTYIRVHNNCL
jgi:hypothetical protein